MPGHRPAGAEGEPLGVYQPRRGVAWIIGGVAASVLLLAFSLLRGGGGWLLSSWVPWALMAAPLLLLGGTAYGTTVAVWRDWLYVRELWYHRWIRLDELTEVDVRPSGPKLRVRLRDRDGRKLVTTLDNLRTEPAVWSTLQPAVERALASDDCTHNPLAVQQFTRT